MEHGFIDRYSGIGSIVHRRDARIKLVVVLSYIIIVVTTPPQHLLAFVIYAGLLLWTAALSQVPLRFIIIRALLVLPFSALVALGLPFLDDHATVVVLGFSLSVKGLWLLAGAIMKSVLSVAALILLVSTTPFSTLLAGLRRLGAPSLFIDLLSLTYRYIFILIDEGMRLRRAAFARGYAPKWLAQAVIVGRLVGNLFLRSYRRAERIYGAMSLRGYNSQMPATTTAPLRMIDGLGLVVALSVLFVVRMFAE